LLPLLFLRCGAAVELLPPCWHVFPADKDFHFAPSPLNLYSCFGPLSPFLRTFQAPAATPDLIARSRRLSPHFILLPSEWRRLRPHIFPFLGPCIPVLVSQSIRSHEPVIHIRRGCLKVKSGLFETSFSYVTLPPPAPEKNLFSLHCET